MLENSDDFSDELDEFEESQDDSNTKKKVRYEVTLLLVCQSVQLRSDSSGFGIHLGGDKFSEQAI